MKREEYFNEIEVLKSASDAKTIVETVNGYTDDGSEVMQAAVAINHAAKCGESHAMWMRPLSKELNEKLEASGYKTKPWERCAKPGDISIIRWG